MAHTYIHTQTHTQLVAVCKNYDYDYLCPAELSYINMPLKLSGSVWISHFSTHRSQITHREGERGGGGTRVSSEKFEHLEFPAHAT